MRILLPDGDERSTLAAARALVGSGHAVTVASRARWSLAGVARGVAPTRLEADPLHDRPAYVAGVARLAAAHHADVVLPVTDASVDALLEGRAHLPPSTRLPFPSLAVWRRATDKATTLAAAERAGLERPGTVVLADADAALPDGTFFPAVLKPHRSVTAEDGSGARKLGVIAVSDRAACLARLRGLPASAFPVLLQREIHGPGEGLFLLRWGGRFLAEFAHRRLREKPPWGGVSVYRESIAPPPGLLAAGRAMLEELDWAGVAMIECKRDLATGRHAFMEINGRLWGSLQLALDAGVDFPTLLVRAATGEPVSPVRTYRVGVRSRWFWGDVDHLYLRLRHGPDRAGAVSAFLHHHRGQDREEIWRWRDPRPFMLESARRCGWPG